MKRDARLAGINQDLVSMASDRAQWRPGHARTFGVFKFNLFAFLVIIIIFSCLNAMLR